MYLQDKNILVVANVRHEAIFFHKILIPKIFQLIFEVTEVEKKMKPVLESCVTTLVSLILLSATISCFLMPTGTRHKFGKLMYPYFFFLPILPTCY